MLFIMLVQACIVLYLHLSMYIAQSSILLHYGIQRMLHEEKENTSVILKLYTYNNYNDCDRILENHPYGRM